VKEASEHPDHRTLRTESCLVRFLLALVADDEPGQRQSDVERVLSVVIDGVGTVEARDFAGEHALELIEAVRDRREIDAGPGRAEECFDSLDGPILRIAAPDTPVPFSTPLEEYFLPKTADIVAAARTLAAY